QVNHYVVPGPSKDFLPGDTVLVLVDPLGPGAGRPDSLVYVSADPTQALRLLPADSRLRPELGIDEAGWRAMSYIADATNDGALRGLVTWAITQAETARR